MAVSKAKYRSKIARSVHETVRGLHRAGLIDKRTKRRFDVSCLTDRSAAGQSRADRHTRARRARV